MEIQCQSGYIIPTSKFSNPKGTENSQKNYFNDSQRNTLHYINPKSSNSIHPEINISTSEISVRLENVLSVKQNDTQKIYSILRERNEILPFGKIFVNLSKNTISINAYINIKPRIFDKTKISNAKDAYKRKKIDDLIDTLTEYLQKTVISLNLEL
jgi:hypothetical protein